MAAGPRSKANDKRKPFTRQWRRRNARPKRQTRDCRRRRIWRRRADPRPAAGLPAGSSLLWISEESYTTFNPMLAEVVGASVFPEHVVAPLRQMLDARSQFIMGRATSVDF